MILHPHISSEQLLEFMPKTSISFISRGSVISVPFEEILQISKTGNETMVHTATGSYHSYHRLQELLNDLPVNQFFRIHRSHVINLQHVSGYSKNTVLAGGHRLPMTAYYRNQLCRHLKEILDRELKTFILHASRLRSPV